MTRIGMVCFPSVGGSGTLAVELARQLEERGHTVTVIARDRPARMSDDARFVRVEPTQHALFDSSPYTLSLARTLVLEAKKRALDVLHLHYAVPHAASALLVRAALGASRPAIVVTVHGTDVTGFGEDAGHAPILAASLRAADVVTAAFAFSRRSRERRARHHARRRSELRRCERLPARCAARGDGRALADPRLELSPRQSGEHARTHDACARVAGRA